VLIRVEVAADGSPISVAIVEGSGSKSLDEAALSAARQSRFIPATRDGKPVAGVAEGPIVFRLE
jgi:TonB family protein